MEGATTISNQLLVTIVGLLLANLATVATIVVRALRSRSALGVKTSSDRVMVEIKSPVLTEAQAAVLQALGMDGITPEARRRLHDIEEREGTFILAINLLEAKVGMDITRLPPRRTV